jgi:Domain of unknown function (DUF5060)
LAGRSDFQDSIAPEIYGTNPTVFYLLILGLLLSSCGTPPTSVGAVEHEPTRTSIPVHDVLELSFRHHGVYRNPYFDVALETDFIAPDGTTAVRKGFYHSGDTWAVRFRPDEAGEWEYRYRFFAGGEVLRAGQGEFRTIPSASPGRVRVNSANPYRWAFDNGQSFFPLGLQNCVRSREQRVDAFYVDGEGRDDGSRRRLSAQEYFALYSQAGFNLLRFSQRNCSYSIHDDLEHYNIATSLATDELLQVATANGFRVMFGFFGYHGNRHAGRTERAMSFLLEKLRLIDDSVSDTTDERIVERERRFISYCVSRWGVYADFWQLLNERKASDDWARVMAAHVRAVDPDDKPVAISWEKPYLPEIAINTPHWYESEKESDSDLRVQELAAGWKKFGKPVLVGEQGNTGMNWDPHSATRMRVRAWTALFQEVGLIFWNTSWSKWGMNRGRYTAGAVANIYLGPEERSYTRVLRQFSNQLDGNVRIAPIAVSLPDSARAYGLVSSALGAVYVHHFVNHDVPLEGLRVKMNLPPSSGLRYKWMDPATGSILGEGRVSPSGGAILAPPFTVDIALLVSNKI